MPGGAVLAAAGVGGLIGLALVAGRVGVAVVWAARHNPSGLAWATRRVTR